MNSTHASIAALVLMGENLNPATPFRCAQENITHTCPCVPCTAHLVSGLVFEIGLRYVLLCVNEHLLLLALHAHLSHISTRRDPPGCIVAQNSETTVHMDGMWLHPLPKPSRNPDRLKAYTATSSTRHASAVALWSRLDDPLAVTLNEASANNSLVMCLSVVQSLTLVRGHLGM